MNSRTATIDSMRLALVGVPNCGKTALFNRLTGSRQHVANYAGVTVERKEGSFVGPARQRQVQYVRFTLLGMAPEERVIGCRVGVDRGEAGG